MGAIFKHDIILWLENSCVGKNIETYISLHGIRGMAHENNDHKSPHPCNFTNYIQ